jgi:hypothetical protein
MEVPLMIKADCLIVSGDALSVRSNTCRYPEAMTQATKSAKSSAKRRAAAERTRGMFAHLAPGISLADELIAERRAEAQAEKQADAQR